MFFFYLRISLSSLSKKINENMTVKHWLLLMAGGHTEGEDGPVLDYRLLICDVGYLS